MVVMFVFPAVMVAALSMIVLIFIFTARGLGRRSPLHRAALAMAYRSAHRTANCTANDCSITTSHPVTDGSSRSPAYRTTEYRTAVRIVGTCRQQ